jgi:hypothetical protein
MISSTAAKVQYCRGAWTIALNELMDVAGFGMIVFVFVEQVIISGIFTKN